MSVFDWIEAARSLDADGLEMYDGFFTSLDDPLPRPGRRGHPRRRLRDADALLLARLHQPRPRRAQAGRGSRGGMHPGHAPARRAGGRLPRPLAASAIRRSAASRGSSGSSAASKTSCPSPGSTTSSSGWRTTTRTASGSTPSSPRSRTSSSNCSAPSPSASISACSTTRPTPSSPGTTRSRCCEAVADRVVSMHASDRYLAEGATLEELRQADGTLGYSPNLRHGVTGKGLNDYDAIFRHPGGARLSRLGQHRGRHERHGRDGRVAGLPAHDGRPLLPGGLTWNACGRPSSAAARSAGSTPRCCTPCPRRTSSPRATPTSAAPRPSPAASGPAPSPTSARCSHEAAVQAVTICTPHPLARRARDPGGEGGRPRARREADGGQPPRLRRHAGGGARGGGQAGGHQPATLVRAGPEDQGRDRRREDRPPRARRLPDVQLARSRLLSVGPLARPVGHRGRRASSSTSPRTSSTCCGGSWATSRRSAATGPTSTTRRSRSRTPPWPPSASGPAPSARSSRACPSGRASTPRSTSTGPTAPRSAWRPTAARRSSPGSRRSPSRR